MSRLSLAGVHTGVPQGPVSLGFPCQPALGLPLRVTRAIASKPATVLSGPGAICMEGLVDGQWVPRLAGVECGVSKPQLAWSLGVL